MDQQQAMDLVAEWRSHPVTKSFHKFLRLRRESLKETWASGGTLGDTEFKNACLQAAATRECQVLAALLEFDEKDLVDTEQQNE